MSRTCHCKPPPDRRPNSVLVYTICIWAAAIALGTGALAPRACGQAPDGVFARAIELAQTRTVKVFGAGAGTVDPYATGLIVSPDGLIVTQQGVFLDGDQVRVGLPSGELVSASVVRRNRQYQLALLKITESTSEYWPLSEQPVAEIGDWVLAVSNAFMVAEREEPLSVNLGIISLPTSIEAKLASGDPAYIGDLVLIDAITSNPGAGGGAVVAVDGSLVGMIGKIINSSETNTRLNYAVPASILRRFVEDTLAPPESARTAANNAPVQLGIELFKVSGRNSPAYIDRVQSGSPAHEIGLKPDDLIISMAGEKVATIRDYERVLATLHADEETVIMVKRGNELIRAQIKTRQSP